MPTRPRQFRPPGYRTHDQQRGNSFDRGYDGDWQKVAELRRVLDKGLCQDCLAKGVLTPTRTVDHIYPVHVRPDWRLELGNTALRCPPCHRVKTEADNALYGSSQERAVGGDKLRERMRAKAVERPPRDGV